MEQKMKIYEIGTGYTPIPAQMGAATEIVVEELTRAFLKQGKNVQIVDIAAEDRVDTHLPIIEVPVPKCFRGTDVKLGVMHKLKRVVYSVSLAFTLRRLLKNSQEKVVLHFHNQYNLFFFLKLSSKRLRSKACIAYTNHSGIWRLPWEEIETTIRKRYFQEAECMRKADIVFVMNEKTIHNTATHLGVPENKFCCVHNGVNVDVYYPLSREEKERVKRNWGLQDRQVILQVGSVCENKGQLRTLQCLLPLLREYRDVTYVYAGGIVEEGYQQQVETLAAEHGVTEQVRYLGMCLPGRQMNELYNLARCTVMMSKFEAFALVTVESIAAGVPVLSEESSPVKLDGGSIHLRKDKFADEIISRLFDNNEAYEQLCVEARETAVKHYSWNRVASEYIAVFENKVNEYV